MSRMLCASVEVEDHKESCEALLCYIYPFSYLFLISIMKSLILSIIFVPDFRTLGSAVLASSYSLGTRMSTRQWKTLGSLVPGVQAERKGWLFRRRSMCTIALPRLGASGCAVHLTLMAPRTLLVLTEQGFENALPGSGMLIC